jgi:Ca2+-binding EF-hand superfamily protein
MLLLLGVVRAAQLKHHSVPDLTAAIKPSQLFDKCQEVAASGLPSPANAHDICKRVISDEKVCTFLAEQINAFAHSFKDKEEEPHPNEFCGKIVQLSSATAKRDTMEYVAPRQKWDVCVNSLLTAMEVGRALKDDKRAIEENIKSSCKTTLEGQFNKMGLPSTIASVACTGFTDEVNKALASGKLDPEKGGQGFCDCAETPCMVEKPLQKSDPCEVPIGFPMKPTDVLGGQDKATILELDAFVKMVLTAYGTSHAAYLATDENGDEKIDLPEWEKLAIALGLEPAKTSHLFPIFDADNNGHIDPLEWAEKMGVSLDGLRARILDAHKNADEAFKAADKDGDGALSGAEFLEHCKKLNVGADDALKLLKEVDKDGDGKISPEEYKNAFGITEDELKQRARDEFGPPSEAFPAMDADGDGKISDEEWAAACEKMGIPKERAAELLKGVDQDGDGQISEDEYAAALGMGLEDLKRDTYGKLGSAEEAMKAMDKDGDGEISEDEFVEEMKKAGYGEKEAEDMFKDLAGEDGSLSAEDWADVTGAEDLADQREEAGVGDTEAMPGVPLPPSAAEADADGDGKVSEKEYLEAAEAAGMSPEEAKASWEGIDKDGKGEVTPEELQAARDRTQNAAADFQAGDTDGDGILSEEEFLAAAKEKGIPDEEALDMFKKMDKDGDGQVSPSEFAGPGSPLVAAGEGENGGEGGLGGASEGAGTPPPIKAEAVPMEEVGDRLGAAFGTAGEAWEDMAGSGDANHMTEDQFLDKAEALGMTPEEAKASYKAMDADGDGKVTFDEFQKAVGVDQEDMKRRMLDKFGNAEEALKAADKDGDGKVSEEEFTEMAEELGIPASEAKKLYEDMAKDSPDGGAGGISAEDFTEDFAADASDMKERLADKFETPSDAFGEFDKDGDGDVSEEEFIAGAKEMGMSEADAKKMFEKADADGSGGLSQDEFTAAFGVGGEEVREACFQFMRDPKFAYHEMDANGDGLLDPEEWKKGMAKMQFTEAQAERLFTVADTNKGENTQGFISRYEFWEFLIYRPHRPHFKYHWNTYYGDLDRWGHAHQKHNKLEHAIFLARRI